MSRNNRDAEILPYSTITPRGYERLITCEDGKPVYCYAHRLLAVAKYGFEAVKGMDVHHKNGCKFDNRIENIELLTHEEHTRHHAQQRSQSKKALADGGEEQ